MSTNPRTAKPIIGGKEERAKTIILYKIAEESKKIQLDLAKKGGRRRRLQKSEEGKELHKDAKFGPTKK